MSFPCDDKYKITERLLALRDRWKEIIAADVAASRHWIYSGVQNMIFLPAEEGERTTLLTTDGSNGMSIQQ